MSTFKDDLTKKKNDLQTSIHNTIIGKRVIAGVSIVMLLVSFYLIYIGSNIIAIVLIILALLILGLVLAVSSSSEMNEIKQIENEMELLSMDEISSEKKAEQLFKNHQLEVKKYYDLTLKNSSYIFMVGLFCILAGLAFITVTLYFIFSNTGNLQVNDKYILSGLSLLSSLMTNFIGSIFLKMHGETVKSLADFHNRLVTTHHIYFANYLMARITDSELRDKALSNVIVKMTQK